VSCVLHPEDCGFDFAGKCSTRIFPRILPSVFPSIRSVILTAIEKNNQKPSTANHNNDDDEGGNLESIRTPLPCGWLQ
jgi:hypothetical protein